MTKAFAALSLLSAVSLGAIAFAQTKPSPEPVTMQNERAQPLAPVTGLPRISADARSVASDAEVGQARRAYRAACSRVENAGFCDCVTAGVSQSLHPDDVRLAARTVRERLTAEGDAAANIASNIADVEEQYVSACTRFR